MDDSALVAAMSEQDPQGLDGVYRRYADRIYAYACSLVGDRESAADVVQDTFVLASQHVRQLRDPNRLRPWLYAIARNEGLRHLRHRKRTAPLEAAGDVSADPIDPAAAVHSAQVVELVRAALGGLTEVDRDVAELTVRHGLAAADIATMLGVSLKHAHARLSRARQQLGIALGVLVVARAQQHSCAGLAELLPGWDGRLNPLLRKRLHRHIEGCAGCAGVRRERFNPAALLSAYATVPFAVVIGAEEVLPAQAPDTFAWDAPDPQWDAETGFPRPEKDYKPSPAAVAIGVVVLVLILGGGAAVLLTKPSAGDGNVFAAPTASSSPVPAGTAPEPPPLAEPPPGSTAPSPSSSPAPKPSSPPAATEFSAETVAEARCTSVTAKTFALSVIATATVQLAAGDLTWRVVNKRVDVDMEIDGKVAQKLTTGQTNQAKIYWWVELTAADGRTWKSPLQNIPHPCS